MTVVAKVPVTLKVIRQLAHGVPPLRLPWPVCVALPVAVKVKEQSGVWAVSGDIHTAAIKSKRGRTLFILVMPLIVWEVQYFGEGL